MKKFRRKGPKKIYAIVFHGTWSSGLTLDHRSAFQSKKGAQRVVSQADNRDFMEVVKYVRSK